MADAFLSRWADERDLDAIRRLMALAIETLQDGFLSREQIAASQAVMGLDTQLIRDRSYLLVEEDGMLVGCGGWSRRATLYGGDHSVALRDAALLDPASDPARLRAMYTHPGHARRGIGRRVLDTCERAAAAAGFLRGELMATLSGEPLYRACGYQPVERIETQVGKVGVPLIRMRKAFELVPIMDRDPPVNAS